MELIVENVGIITGDGHTFHPSGHIGIAAGRIASVSPGPPGPDVPDRVARLDGDGGMAFPGVINAHAHGCIDGPAMPSGSRPFPAHSVNYARNRHLLGGTTSLVNVCGLALPSEINARPERGHPLQIYVSTAHTPACLAAARAVDGEGLTDMHLAMGVDAAVASGAVALGEGGGGQTLGGGAQDYRLIPDAIASTTGVVIGPRHARLLKETLLGRDLENAALNPDREFCELCHKLGLLEDNSPGEIALTIANSVMPPVTMARRGLEDLAQASERTGLPAILHTAVPSAANVIDLARRYRGARIIAAHCNHPSFTPQEAVSTATELRELGVAIDVSTLDTISTHWRNSADNLDALVDAGLVDTVSTDFAGGHWDGILEAIHRMISCGQISAPGAIALATGNVARRFLAFADRGVIEPGKRADIAIADSKNLSRVRHLIIGGKLVVKDGAIIA